MTFGLYIKTMVACQGYILYIQSNEVYWRHKGVRIAVYLRQSISILLCEIYPKC